MGGTDVLVVPGTDSDISADGWWPTTDEYVISGWVVDEREEDGAREGVKAADSRARSTGESDRDLVAVWDFLTVDRRL